jgi:hypothetical protein
MCSWARALIWICADDSLSQTHEYKEIKGTATDQSGVVAVAPLR